MDQGEDKKDEMDEMEVAFELNAGNEFDMPDSTLHLFHFVTDGVVSMAEAMPAIDLSISRDNQEEDYDL